MNNWDDGGAWIQWRRCASKETYTSRREAKQGRRRMKIDRGILLSIYRCPDCRGYHLGHDRRHNTPRINPAYIEMQAIHGGETDSHVDND